MLNKWADISARAERYKANCVYFSELHYRAAEAAYFRHRALGIPLVIVGTVITTSIFATLNTTPGIGWKIAAGVISLFGAVLAALQTFLKFLERASEHKAAAAAYRSVARSIDIFLLKYGGTPPEGDATLNSALEQLEKLTNAISDLARSSPQVARTVDDLQSSERIP